MADIDPRKAELIAEVNRARSRAGANWRELADDSNVPAMLKTNIARHRPMWLTSAIVIGVFIAKLPARTKKIMVNHRGKQHVSSAGRAGLFMAALKLLIDATKPMLMAWATKRLGQAVSVGKSVQRKVDRVEAKT